MFVTWAFEKASFKRNVAILVSGAPVAAVSHHAEVFVL
jgi:hypothetical protein